MNTLELLQNTINAFKNSEQLSALEKHIKDLETSTLALKEELHTLLPQQTHLPETLGIVSSVLENIEAEISNLLQKHKEIEMTLLTNHFVAPIMEYINNTLKHPTRVQINYVEKDTEVQIEILNGENVETLILVPDFTEGRVLFVANSELCNLSPLGSLKNSFGHELLVAPQDLKTLIRLLNLK